MFVTYHWFQSFFPQRRTADNRISSCRLSQLIKIRCRKLQYVAASHPWRHAPTSHPWRLLRQKLTFEVSGQPGGEDFGKIWKLVEHQHWWKRVNSLRWRITCWYILLSHLSSTLGESYAHLLVGINLDGWPWPFRIGIRWWSMCKGFLQEILRKEPYTK